MLHRPVERRRDRQQDLQALIPQAQVSPVQVSQALALQERELALREQERALLLVELALESTERVLPRQELAWAEEQARVVPPERLVQAQPRLMAMYRFRYRGPRCSRHHYRVHRRASELDLVQHPFATVRLFEWGWPLPALRRTTRTQVAHSTDALAPNDMPT